MSRARELSRLGNPNIISADSSFNVGFGSTEPKEKVHVVGVVSATSFYGDGSTLEGIASAGIGTALSDDKTKALNTIYYTNNEVLVTNNSTINPPDSGHIAYTQAPTVVVADSTEITISDGDDLLVDVLGIATGTNVDYAARGNGVFGNIYVDNIYNQSGQTSVNFPLGFVSAGITTITNVTQSTSPTTGALQVLGGVGIAKSVYIGGNLSVGGTITYEDVTNVDSVGIITARKGIKVTTGGIDIAGGGIDVVGDIGLGAGKATGTSGQLLTSGGPGADASWTTVSSAPEFAGIASGSITGGKGVCVADDGKLMGVAGSNELQGTSTVVGEATNDYSIAYHAAADRYLYFWRDTNGGDVGQVQVGTPNGATITWETKQQFTPGSVNPSQINAIYDSTNEKVVVAYRDNVQSGSASVQVCDVSGTTITIGTAVNNASDINSMEYSSFCFCPNTGNYALCFNDGGTNKGWCRIGKYSGTNSSSWPNNRVQFLNAQARGTGCWYDTTANKLCVVTHHGGDSNHGYIWAGTVANDSVTFGTGQKFDASNTDGAQYSGAHDSDSGKNVICYGTGAHKGNLMAATLSGTTFTFGPGYNFGSNATSYKQVVAYGAGPKKFMVSYVDGSNNDYVKSVIATLTGTTITYSTPTIFQTRGNATTHSGIIVYNANAANFLMLNRTDLNSNSAAYYIEAIRVSNVTKGNYVGIANASYTNGQTASTALPGAVNTAVSGLTVGQKYYVVADGTLSTTADSESIDAGNSIATNKLLVR